MAYLLQAHEAKLMTDIIVRRILEEMPGAFLATIHDSIMTMPDRTEAIRGIMVEEFRRFGLNRSGRSPTSPPRYLVEPLSSRG